MDILAGGVTVNITIISLFNQIIPQYFSQLNSLAIVVDESPSRESYRTYMDNLETSFRSMDFLPVFWITIPEVENPDFLEEKLLEITELGCQGFIIATPGILEFLSAEYEVIQKSLQRHRNKYMVFLIDDPDEYLTNEILNHEALQFFPEHLIVRRTKDYNFELITQKFVTDSKIEEGLILDTLQQNETFSNSRQVDLFPDKLKDLQGKIFKMGALTYIPYVLIKHVPPGQGNVDEVDKDAPKTIFFDGAEARTLIEFSKIRNFTLKMKRFENDSWGALYENGSSDGIVGSIYRKEIDFGLGAVSMWYYNKLDYSFTLAKVTVKLIVPAAKVLPRSLTPILPFTWDLWLSILLSIVIIILILFFIERQVLEASGKSKTLSCTALTVSAIYLQQATSERTKRSSIRILRSILLLSGVIIVNSYSGGLASVLTVPKYQERIDTNRQLAASGTTWVAPSCAWVYSLMAYEEPYFKTIVNNFQVKDYDEMRQLSLKGEVGFGIEKTTSGDFALGPFIREDVLDNFDLMKEDVFFEWATPNSIRGWPLMDYFNKHVLEVLQHGHYDYWEHRTLEKYTNVKVQVGMQMLKTGHRPNPRMVGLQIEHISGPIFVWVMGLALATAVFLLELVFGAKLSLSRNLRD
ncbi:Ionotropic glutamate receptor [Sergentomyia squamirostris]